MTNSVVNTVPAEWQVYVDALNKAKNTPTMAHIWSDESKLRERMNEIEKALFGAGAKL